jgi:hypothetical protein
MGGNKNCNVLDAINPYNYFVPFEKVGKNEPQNFIV